MGNSRALLYETSFKDRIPPHLHNDPCEVCAAYARYRTRKIAAEAEVNELQRMMKVEPRQSKIELLFWLCPAAIAVMVAIVWWHLW